MKTVAFTIFTALCLSLTHAQEAKPKTNTIHVIGTAELEIVPDEVYMTITVTEQTREKKKFMIEDLEKNLVNFLEKINSVEKKDIKMEDLDARIIALKRKKNKDEIIAKSYTVKLKNSKQVQNVYAVMDSLFITNAYISKYSHSKMDDYKKQIKINAIKAARDKADYLTAAIGQKAGKAVNINETYGYVGINDGSYDAGYRNRYSNVSQSYRSFGGNVDEALDVIDTSIGEKTIKLTYTIEADFSLE